MGVRFKLQYLMLCVFPFQVLGTEELYEYLDKYQIDLDPRFNDILGRWVDVTFSILGTDAKKVQ